MMSLATSTLLTVLPNPDLEDSEGWDAEVVSKRAMEGTRYSYIRRPGTKIFTYTFSHIGRGKLVEVQEFFKATAGEAILVTDYRGTVRRMFFREDPITFTTDERSDFTGDTGERSESGTMVLEFVERDDG